MPERDLNIHESVHICFTSGYIDAEIKSVSISENTLISEATTFILAPIFVYMVR